MFRLSLEAAQNTRMSDIWPSRCNGCTHYILSASHTICVLHFKCWI